MSLWQKRPTPTPGYQVQMMEGELLLFQPAGQIIMHGNETAVLVWQLCDGQRTMADIVEVLAVAYPEAVTDIKRDVPELLAQFAANDAIEWR